MNYTIFMKHMQKLTKAVSASRPILKGVHHAGTTLAATDSHRAYYVTNMPHIHDNAVVDPVTGALIENGTYPSLSRIVPDPKGAKTSFPIAVAPTLQAIKVFESAGKVDKATNLVHINNSFLDSHEDSLISCAYPLAELSAEYDDIQLTVNVKYLKEAFELLKDGNFQTVQLNYHGAKRPLTLTADNLTIVIMPVHTSPKEETK